MIVVDENGAYNLRPSIAPYNNVTFKVTTEELINKAQAVKDLGAKMLTNFEAMAELMEKTKGYWIGEAGELHRQRYAEQKDDISRMMNRLMEHPDDLLFISGNYEAVEKEVIEQSLSLRSDLF